MMGAALSAFDSEVLDVQLFEGGTNKSWLPFITMQDKDEPAAEPAAETATEDAEEAQKKREREAAVAEILKNKEAAEAEAAKAAAEAQGEKTVGTMQTNIKENERRL